MFKLSVIIPVYKVEAFLKKCVESVLSQRGCDLEVILVDDCSPDSCGRICDEYANADSRVQVVHHTENRGLSVARNSGIAVAVGDYISFIDSDDFIEVDTFANNIELLQSEHADVVEFPVNIYSGVNFERYIPAEFGYKTESFRDWFVRQGYVHSYAWNKIYRRQLFDGISFPEGRYFEDVFTIPYVLQKANKIIASSYGCYHYCDANSGAITKKTSKQKRQDLFESNKQLFEYVTRGCEFSGEELYPCYMSVLDTAIMFKHEGGIPEMPKFNVRLSYMLQRQTMSRRLKALLVSLMRPGFTVRLFSRYGNVN